MFHDDLMKMSMTTWLVVILGIKVGCAEPATEEERYYQRY